VPAPKLSAASISTATRRCRSPDDQRRQRIAQQAPRMRGTLVPIAVAASM
jgi:hypothetical protein